MDVENDNPENMIMSLVWIHFMKGVLCYQQALKFKFYVP